MTLLADITLPLRTVSEANARDNRWTKAARVREQRAVARMALAARRDWRPRGTRYVVTLTRVAPRRLDDDNLRGALKAVRDGVADALGIDDGSDAVEWRYRQERALPGRQVFGYGVRVWVDALG